MLIKIPSYVMAASLLVSATALGYMTAQRTPPTDVLSSELVVSRVRPGTDLERRVEIVQKRRCEIHSDRFMFDSKGTRFDLPPVTYQSGIGLIGKKQKIIIRLPVPGEMAFGPARFQQVTRYRCNLIHYLWPVYRETVIDFEVIPL